TTPPAAGWGRRPAPSSERRERRGGRMARSVCWLLFLLMAAAFGAGVAVLLRDRALAGHGMPAYSVYSDAGDGLGEAAHLLRALGWTPVALDRPVQNSQARGLLLLVEPD